MNRSVFAICVLSAALAFQAPGPIRFERVDAGSGLNFTLENEPTPVKRMIETMPGGVAVFDYDGDGRPDIFFTNGAAGPDMKKSSPKYFNRLFRNEGNMKFRDVTEEAGLAGDGYSMGVAAGDFDNDGHVDLFVAGVYHNTLYRNLGNGKFADVTAKSGIKSNEWSVTAGWIDVDNDGLLDLVVVNYGTWTPGKDRFCGDANIGLRVYCHPKYFDPRPNQIYRNRGDGTFEDISASSGIAAHRGRAMGVAFADYDGDGLMDIFVTNDNMPNFLFHNLGKGKFEEVALMAGVALRDQGNAVASMGTDFRDYDNDGLPDIIVVALNNETFPLFHNDGKGLFHDATYESHIARSSVGRGGWGPGFFDFNNDGLKDLFVTNSHVNDVVEKVEAAVYKQPNTVFTNVGQGKFEIAAGSGLEKDAKAHRGTGFADFDGDGRMDVAVSSLGAPVELWRNVSPNSGHWLSVKLHGTKSNRDGIGAVIHLAGQTNHMTEAVGYSSSSLVGVHFGVGALTRIPEVQIRWPSGTIQTLKDVAADQELNVTEP